MAGKVAPIRSIDLKIYIAGSQDAACGIEGYIALIGWGNYFAIPYPELFSAKNPPAQYFAANKSHAGFRHKNFSLLYSNKKRNMSTLLLTLSFAFAIVIIAFALLAIGWLLTGKARLQTGACGRDPHKKRSEECSSCTLC